MEPLPIKLSNWTVTLMTGLHNTVKYKTTNLRNFLIFSLVYLSESVSWTIRYTIRSMVYAKDVECCFLCHNYYIAIIIL